jgi:hypothetical protein
LISLSKGEGDAVQFLIRNSGTIAWVVGLLASGVWLMAFRWILGKTLGRMSEHWFPFLLIILVYLIIAGRFASDLGIPLLFRDDPADSSWFWLKPSFLGALGATLLILQVWSVVFFYKYIGHFEELEPLGSPDISWGRPSNSLDPVQFARNMVKFLVASVPPFLVLLMIAALFPAPVPGAPTPTLTLFFHTFFLSFVGIACGIMFFFFAFLIPLQWVSIPDKSNPFTARLILAMLGRGASTPSAGQADEAVMFQGSKWNGLIRKFVILFKTYSLMKNDHTKTRQAIAITGMIWYVMIAFLSPIVFFLLSRDILVPSLAISVLLMIFVTSYFLLISLRGFWQVPFALGVVILMVITNNGPYKYRFPGMGPDSRDGSAYARGNLVRLEDWVQKYPPGTRPPDPVKPLLDQRLVLDAWKKHTGQERPKLVLVAVTGGAYRAGFWTAVVLDELVGRDRPGGLAKFRRLLAEHHQGMRQG